MSVAAVRDITPGMASTLANLHETRSVPGATANHSDRLVIRHRVSALVVVLVLFAGCLVATLENPRRVAWPLHTTPEDRAQLRAGIDPNTAQWFELAQLPGIGESLAKRIVAFRRAAQHAAHQDGRSVFHRPADLTGVTGIGGKTVRRLAQFLRFPPSEGEH